MNWDMLNKDCHQSFTEFLVEMFPDVMKLPSALDFIKTIEPDFNSVFEFLKKYDLKFYAIRNLFDYFDSKQIFISINFFSDEFEHGFNYEIRFNFRSDDENPHDEDFNFNLKRTRSETEIAAFTRAFKIREKQLQEVKP